MEQSRHHVVITLPLRAPARTIFWSAHDDRDEAVQSAEEIANNYGAWEWVGDKIVGNAFLVTLAFGTLRDLWGDH